MLSLTCSFNLQFYLDMKFVICFASQGRYLSRNLHRVVNEIISKAIAAFATTGMDPYRYEFKFYSTSFRIMHHRNVNVHGSCMHVTRCTRLYVVCRNFSLLLSCSNQKAWPVVREEVNSFKIALYEFFLPLLKIKLIVHLG